MTNFDTPSHARGATLFVDDIPEPADMLFAAVFTSPFACGNLRGIDASIAEEADGVARVFTAKDIPGENEIGGIIPDETLLADGEVDFAGQPVAVVVAESTEAARKAAALLKVDIAEHTPILDPREAAAQGRFVVPSRTISLGDVDSAWDSCETVVDGRADSGGQEHVYLETQASVAVPLEKGRIRLFSGTQSPTAIQKMVARILGKAMNEVEVEVRHLGGGFGGKEDQATPWACMAAMAADALQRPVKLTLRRHDDMRFTGKRHPYSSDFKIGLDGDGRILAYEATYYQNSGAVADLSPAIMERSLFHATNSYFIPNVRVTGMCCKTNLPPFTAFRGFGAPQAMFVTEAAIAKAAETIGVAAVEIQRKNLLSENDQFPYGMRVKGNSIERCFAAASDKFNLADIQTGAAAFNAENRHQKRGVSVIPVCFGISFTKTMLNQAGSLVHVYTDGSVAVSTGVVEMGQGVNTKIRSVAARTLGIPAEKIIIENTNTTRVANTSPTAASSGADLNGMAAHIACKAILGRLKRVAARILGAADEESLSIEEGKVLYSGGKTALDWEQLVSEAYCERTNLSAQAFYATPDLRYDAEKEKGVPFAYHVFGAAVTEATVDCIRGTYTIDAVHIVHDAGRSLDSLIDKGQVEGALLQGIGWTTIEELIYGDKGELITGSLATYKVPDLYFAPKTVDTVFLEDSDNPHAIMQSKAIGEPPFIYGIGSYFAIMNALKAFRPEKPSFHAAPLTAEKALVFLHGED